MATYTTNYNLDKYEGTDSPNLTDQYNSAMDKIDAQMMTNAQSAQTAQTAAGNAQTTAQAAQTAAATAQSAATAASTAAGEAQTAAINAQSAADNAASQAATKAPISHASSALTYGGGTATNYGHVMLRDTVTGGEGAANSTAATPAAVNAALATLKQWDNLATPQGSLAGNSTGTYNAYIRNNSALGLINITISFTVTTSPATTRSQTTVYTLDEQYHPTQTITLATGVFAAGDLTNLLEWDISVDTDGSVKFTFYNRNQINSGVGGTLTALMIYGLSS